MLAIFGDRLFATAKRFYVYKCVYMHIYQNDYLFMNYLLITKNYS